MKARAVKTLPSAELNAGYDPFANVRTRVEKRSKQILETVSEPPQRSGKESGPYRLANDDSGHCYVIPVARAKHWDSWIGSEAWQDGDVPLYAEAVGGSETCVEFNDYTIR